MFFFKLKIRVFESFSHLKTDTTQWVFGEFLWQIGRESNIQKTMFRNVSITRKCMIIVHHNPSFGSSTLIWTEALLKIRTEHSNGYFRHINYIYKARRRSVSKKLTYRISMNHYIFLHCSLYIFLIWTFKKTIFWINNNNNNMKACILSLYQISKISQQQQQQQHEGLYTFFIPNI